MVGTDYPEAELQQFPACPALPARTPIGFSISARPTIGGGSNEPLKEKFWLGPLPEERVVTAN